MAVAGAAEQQQYLPTPGPRSADPGQEEVVLWAQRELEKIGARFTNHSVIQHNVLHVEPTRPREGMTVIADGSDWDPGSGRGQYIYLNGDWVLSSGVTPSTPARPPSYYDAEIDFNVPFDGSDGTVELQLAVDTAVADGKALFIPGSALVSSPIIASGPIDIFGDGRDTSGIGVGATNCTTLIIQGTGSSVRMLGLDGSVDFAADQPTLILEPGANNCQIEHNGIQGGQYCILNRATDNTFINNEVRYAYGSALVKGTEGSGNFWFRNKMDQVWPFGQPPNGTSGFNPRANTTGYSAGDVVTVDGWRIQAIVGGTSGGSFPGLLPYEGNIVDGSVTWQIVSPDSDYYSYQMDTGSSEVFMLMNDHSGCFKSGIGVTNTGEFGSGEPGLLWIDNAILGQHTDNALRLAAGSRVGLVNSEVNAGIFDGGTGVGSEGTWSGQIRISGNTIGGHIDADGVKLYAAQDWEGAKVVDNTFTTEFGHLVNVDTGGGSIQKFRITDNDALVPGPINIDVNTDWFDVSHNNTLGGGVNNSSAGSNFIDTPNL